jgi:hypothetical protein
MSRFNLTYDEAEQYIEANKKEIYKHIVPHGYKKWMVVSFEEEFELSKSSNDSFQKRLNDIKGGDHE